MYLNCHSYFSLRYGAFSENDLLELATANKTKFVALTDINNTSACLNFIKHSKNFPIKPLVGIDFRNGVDQQYVVIAKNRNGFREMNQHLSDHLHAKKNFDEKAPILDNCYVIYPFKKVLKNGKTDFSENEFIGVSVRDLNKLKFSEYKKYTSKLVVLQSVSFRSKKDFNAHRLLRAIDNNTLLSKLPLAEQGDPEDRMLPESELIEIFKEFPEILSNTEALAEKCNVEFTFSKKQNNNLSKIEGKKADEFTLRKLCFENIEKRYPEATEEVYARLDKELSAIIKLGFVSYFLINYEIVKYARKKKYPVIGRGSGANSIVAYIIGITNVDPIELDLYFERFINENRSSPPDFDIDFSWKDREDVTRFIFDRYDNVALMGTYVTFKRRAVIRELGKVFGLPKANIDKLSLARFAINELDQMELLVIRYSKLIAGFPNYLSVHSGGILILDDEVFNYGATFLPPKNFQTIQIDMNIAEEVGIHKFDILAQRGLSKITDTLELIQRNQPEAFVEDIDDIPKFKNDPKINNLLKTGDCMGVFYVESPAMRGLLTKLQTQDYMNLVAASSIIRPGISSGGMKEEYIKRHRDPARRKEGHPVMLKIMDDTYGIMVYQEDVMKVAHHFAGLSFDDADVLRRGMSGKKTSKGQMEKIEAQFRSNCEEKGYSLQITDEVWEQISSFAGYAFPKGHSASYAVESYQSLYLKKYFPLEFMVAVLNNGGGFYSVETYIQEIKNCGGKVHAPCINNSDHPNTIFGTDIYLGFGYIKELETKTVQQILENRQFFGTYKSLNDFIDRIEISIEQLRILLKVGAFRFTGKDKHQLLWEAYFRKIKSKKKTTQAGLFKIEHKEYDLPQFRYSALIDAYDHMELLGFPLCSYFDLLLEPVSKSMGVRDLRNFVGKEVCIYGKLICTKNTTTVNGKQMCFATFYDINYDIFDTVQFPNIVAKYPLYNQGVYCCVGKVVDEFDYLAIEAKAITFQKIKVDPRLVSSQFSA
ncbi:DNA polymerase III subunit alpha [Zunongwangia endophytica]|uniref:DNA-directed DNA polymerase n=1 Tax=Zunongwangia endophytica TaxID=1808945 RepID=A0ABV8HBK8_9FLAO|nr:DNA polymerase III subunit alpha [Zunongwangia endophytica]MDN3596320.1 DNA polymerase III subunit alpha [Zunongwangia endophytica]